jgi:DNA-binding MarR family transcriptional regulator
VLPAHIRYNQVLSDFEKILYSEIVALSNALGYCYASNNYFAKVYNKSVSTISRSINNLEKYEFVKTHIDKENGNKRRIYIVIENYFKMSELSKKEQESIYRELELNNIKLDGTISENDYTPMSENAKYNNTSINTKINNDFDNIVKIFNNWYNRK